jgi:hypothetical protein
MFLACWSYFIDEQRPCTPLEVVAHLPYYLAMLAGLALLTCRPAPTRSERGIAWFGWRRN